MTSVDLPEPDTPVTATNSPSGNATSMSWRLCSRAPWTASSRPSVRGRRMSGSGISRRPERYCPVSESGWASRSCDGAAVHDLAAVLAGARADVDHPVGGPDRVLVVLDHDQRVAEVLEPDEGLDQPVVVALVQPDRRLVEHVEHADQAGADLRGQPDALGLAAGQRPGGPVEREVVEADVEQEPEPLLDLLEHPLGDLALARGQVEVAQELGGLVDRQRADLGDVAAAERHRHRDRLEPAAAARRARHLAHEALEALAAGVGLGLAVPALDVRWHPLERRVVGALAAVAVAGDARGPSSGGPRGATSAPWPGGPATGCRCRSRARCPARPAAGGSSRRRGPRSTAGSRPRRGCRSRSGTTSSGSTSIRVPSPWHYGAGAERRVEGERAGLELVGVDGVVVGARHLLAELAARARRPWPGGRRSRRGPARRRG